MVLTFMIPYMLLTAEVCINAFCNQVAVTVKIFHLHHIPTFLQHWLDFNKQLVYSIERSSCC